MECDLSRLMHQICAASAHSWPASCYLSTSLTMELCVWPLHMENWNVPKQLNPIHPEKWSDQNKFIWLNGTLLLTQDFSLATAVALGCCSFEAYNCPYKSYGLKEVSPCGTETIFMDRDFLSNQICGILEVKTPLVFITFELALSSICMSKSYQGNFADLTTNMKITLSTTGSS